MQQQGPDEPAPAWVLPGGRVKVGESFIEALVREVREETGLAIETADRLLYVAHVENRETAMRGRGDLPGPGDTLTVFVFEVTSFSGTLKPADPDEFILDAAFLPPDVAIQRLEAVPLRVMREPIVHALRREAPYGTLWMFRQEEDGEALLSRVPAQRRLVRPGVATPADARAAQERSLIAFGCLVILGLTVVIVIAGIIATVHPF